MKIFCKIFFSVVLVLFPLMSLAQVDVMKMNEVDFPKFYYNMSNFYSMTDNQSRIDILIQVPYKNLRFIKESNKFICSYEIGITINDSSNEVYDRSYNRNLETKDFQTTSSQQNYDLVQKSFNLKPGKYVVEILITDNDSRKAYKASKNIEVRDFQDEKIKLSDIMLIAKSHEVDGKKMMIPNVSNNIGNLDDKFEIFFEVYSPKVINDSIAIKYSIINKDDDTVNSKTANYFINDKTNPIFLTIDKKNLVFGAYKLMVEINSEKYKNIIQKSIIGRNFVVRWQDLPISVNDLDLAIRQTAYIAPPEEISKMEAAKDPKDKLVKFLAYWRDRKPSLEEYFARVDYANEKFKTHRDGWKTDMGMVFIIFGAPDNVDRHPFEMGSAPYEIWDYYTINRRFIFVDETGFGEYRTVYPIWDDTIKVQ
jgi:GWxTD domain-containing protein